MPLDHHDDYDPHADAWEDERDAPLPDDLIEDENAENDTRPCPACGRAVYEDVEQCPHCGEWITGDQPHARHPATIVVILAVAAGLLWWLLR